MLGQQLQDANELPRAGLRPQPVLQALAHLGEQRRQLPIPEDVGMVQSRRPSSQADQVMQWLKDLLMLLIPARVPGHDLRAGHHLDAVHVALDGYRGKGVSPRHAIAIAVELHGLVFVDLGWPHDAGIKSPLRQG